MIIRSLFLCLFPSSSLGGRIKIFRNMKASGFFVMKRLGSDPGDL